MNKSKITLSSLFFLLCFIVQDSEYKGKELYQTYCGSCHALPDPTDLPRDIWAQKVLPEMGARLGIQTAGYDPLRGWKPEEQTNIKQQKIYPQEQLLTTSEWKSICDYVLKTAPVTLPPITALNLKIDLPQFVAQEVNIDAARGANTTCIAYDDVTQQIMVGNISGELYGWSPDEVAANLIEKINTGIVGYQRTAERTLLLEIGSIPPSTQSEGNLHQIKNGRLKTVEKRLHRPVYLLDKDLNQDGNNEIIVSEYGHFAGQLSMIKTDEKGKTAKENLLSIPGIVRVVAEDMDGDGRTDLVLLAAQGDEGVDILYQEDNLKFRRERVLRFSPVYGSSWFELVDFNRDGQLDIVTVNGDNADLSYTEKPYHGLRIFINNGKNKFIEKHFLPLPGATRVITKDFDQDGDIDIAVSCFFPDYLRQPQGGFVYLENISTANYQFTTRTFPQSTNGRWLIMESADYDRDGDEDLILGSFVLPVTPVPPYLSLPWRMGNTDIITLENQLFK